MVPRGFLLPPRFRRENRVRGAGWGLVHLESSRCKNEYCVAFKFRLLKTNCLVMYYGADIGQQRVSPLVVGRDVRYERRSSPISADAIPAAASQIFG